MRSKIATPTVQNTNKKERDGREARVVGGKEGGWEGDGEHVSSTLIESSASNPPATLGAAGGSIVIEPCMQQTAQKLQLGSWRVDTQQSDACLTVNIPPASCVFRSQGTFHAPSQTKGVRKNGRSGPVFVGLRRVLQPTRLRIREEVLAITSERFLRPCPSSQQSKSQPSDGRAALPHCATRRRGRTLSCRQHALPMKPCVPSLRAHPSALSHRLSLTSGVRAHHDRLQSLPNLLS